MRLELDTPAKIQAGTYVKRVFAMWFARNAWWLLLLLAACASLSAIDARWSVFAFILCLAGMIMVMNLVYFNYVFSPLARWSVMEKTITMDAAGIQLKFEHPKAKDRTIEWDRVRSIQFMADCTVFHITHNVENGKPVSSSAINFLMLPPLTQEQVKTVKALYL